MNLSRVALLIELLRCLSEQPAAERNGLILDFVTVLVIGLLTAGLAGLQVLAAMTISAFLLCVECRVQAL